MALVCAADRSARIRAIAVQLHWMLCLDYTAVIPKKILPTANLTTVLKRLEASQSGGELCARKIGAKFPRCSESGVGKQITGCAVNVAVIVQ